VLAIRRMILFAAAAMQKGAAAAAAVPALAPGAASPAEGLPCHHHA